MRASSCHCRYAERIDNADELLESFIEGFHDEQAQVQLQLLTAVVKLFLKKPAENRELVQQVRLVVVVVVAAAAAVVAVVARKIVGAS